MTNSAKLWLQMGRGDHGKPALRSIHCCGIPCGAASHVILYEQVDIDRFHYRRTSAPIQGALRTAQALTDLDYIVQQTNFSQRIELIIGEFVSIHISKTGTNAGGKTIASQRASVTAAVDAGTASWWWWRPLRSVLLYTIIAPILGLCTVFLWIHHNVLQSVLPSSSMLCQTVEYRIREVFAWAASAHFLQQQVRHLPTRARELFKLARWRVEFNDSILRVAVDVALGWLLCAMLFTLDSSGSSACDQAKGPGQEAREWAGTGWLAAVVHAAYRLGAFVHHELLLRAVVSLMGVPAGLKLNAQFGRMLGNGVLVLFEQWSFVLGWLFKGPVVHIGPSLVRGVCVCGLFGLSSAIAAVVDVLRLSTCHIAAGFSVFGRLHQLELRILGSLWRLFRGKKYNVLRRRVDSCEYDTDQLLLGTLLFTIVVFLFPTTLVYFVFFTLVTLAVELILGVMRLTVLLLAACPFYSLYLWFSSPVQSLPCAIYFEQVNGGSDSIGGGWKEVVADSDSDDDDDDDYDDEEGGYSDGEVSSYEGSNDVKSRKGRDQPEKKANKTVLKTGVTVAYLQLHSVAAPFDHLFRWCALASATVAALYPPGSLLQTLFFGQPLHPQQRACRLSPREGGQTDGVYATMLQAQLHALPGGSGVELPGLEQLGVYLLGAW
jgi:hypothetical protein